MKLPATYFSLNCIAILSIGVVASTSGCTKLDSGAYAEPSVRVKPAEELVATTSDSGVTGTTTAAASGETSPASAAGGPGKLVGRVTFSGTKPSQGILIKKGTSQKDGNVCAADADILNEDLLIGDDNGVANVFVYLDKVPAGFKPQKPTEAATFDQKGCVFTTHALVCQVGQQILVLSDDDIAHNTHTFPARNDPFNSTIKPKDRTGIPLSYKKPEKTPFAVKCDLHAWMLAYHLPLDHPFAAVSGKDGKFEIANLPAGKYDFKVWHERAEGGKGGFLNRKLTLTIKPGEETSASIDAKASDFGL